MSEVNLIAIQSVIQPFTMSHEEGLNARLKFQLDNGITRLDELTPTIADYRAAKPAGVQPWSQSSEGMARLAMYNRLFAPSKERQAKFKERSAYVAIVRVANNPTVKENIKAMLKAKIHLQDSNCTEVQVMSPNGLVRTIGR